MAEKSSYRTQSDAVSLQRTKNTIRDLPPYVNTYINSRFASTSAQTMQQYAYSIRRFFVWLQESVPHLNNKPMSEITCEDLSLLTARDIEEFMIYLQTGKNKNSRAGVAQKVAAVGSLFKYLYRHDDISADPFAKIERPKLVQDKRIIYLTDEECILLINAIEFGTPNIPDHQMAYLEKTRCRDLAIATLMLDTGVRLSECIGLDIDDVNLRERKIQIYRKGGKYQYLPINEEVAEILEQYIAERKNICVSKKEDAKALFLSMRNSRISRLAIEQMIRKYVLYAGITKPITPHKLRKTYGTSLYQKTRDIYLTANALGHENVATTSRHYVDDNAESLREVANEISVRKKSVSNSQT